jgi:hypothetical protein
MAKSTFKYQAPKGMKRIRTISGRFGIARLLANEGGEHFGEVFFFRSSVGGKVGDKKEKATRLFTPMSRVDYAKMNVSQRPEGKGFNEIEALSKAVNGKRAGLALIPQAPVAAEAPVAAPVAA